MKSRIPCFSKKIYCLYIVKCIENILNEELEIAFAQNHYLVPKHLTFESFICLQSLPEDYMLG